jgi:hypothetical protein
MIYKSIASTSSSSAENYASGRELSDVLQFGVPPDKEGQQARRNVQICMLETRIGTIDLQEEVQRP